MITTTQAMALRMTARAAFRAAAEKARNLAAFPAVRRLQTRAMRDALVTFEVAHGGMLRPCQIDAIAQAIERSLEPELGPEWAAIAVGRPRLTYPCGECLPCIHGGARCERPIEPPTIEANR